MSLIDDVRNFFGGGSSAGSAVGALLSAGGTERAKQNIRDVRGQITGLASDYATRAGQATEFQPFAVTTGAGTARFGAEGGLTTTPTQQGLASSLQARAGQQAGQLGQGTGAFGGISQSALQQAQQQLGQATPTAQSLFSEMQAMRQPEQERQRLALENRLAAQGRLGTQTAAFGGTPEALALNKAIQEQQSADLVAARQLAPQLAQQQLNQATGLFNLGSQAMAQPTALEAAQIQNIGGLLGTSFLPEQQLISSLTPSLEAARLAQAGRASEAETLGQLGPEVLRSVLGTGETEATLEQQQINALLQALGIDYAPEMPGTTINVETPVNIS